MMDYTQTASSAPSEPRSSKHTDRIEKLDDIFYIRWTCGPDYERAFICVEDGEPDMNDIASVGFKRAAAFAEAYRFAMGLHNPQETPNDPA